MLSADGTPPDRSAAAVSALDIAAFQRDGAVCLRQLLTPADIRELEAGIELNLAKPSPRAKIASTPQDRGRFIEDFCNWQENRHYRRVIFESELAAAAGRLMQSSTARLYHDHMLTKEADTQQPTPWHQDQPFYNIDGSQNVSFWIPVDPIARNATLEFIAGSHRGPWLMPRSFMDAQAKWFPEGSLADLPDIAANRGAHEILGWALEPGDVVGFHMLTLHAAGGAGPTRRRVFSVRFIGDDIRHAPRRWRTSPEFPGLAAELPAGVAMHHPLFPLLWEAAPRSAATS